MIKKNSTTSSKLGSNSLLVRFLCIFLASLSISVGIYFLCNSIGGKIIQDKYMTTEAQALRVRNYTRSFQAYVRSNSIKSDDLNAVANWTKENKYVHIIIFDDKRPRADIEKGHATSLIGTQYEDLFKAKSNSYAFTPVVFSDGIYRVYVDEYSYTWIETLTDTISLIISATFVILMLLIYATRITKQISALSKAAQEIENGNLDYEIKELGSDEIGLLSRNMNNMRISIQERIISESEARKANADLITAISHDLRTPLTTLIGYMELLSDGIYTSEEQRIEFTNIAHDKAMRLKELTDELFKYFLVFDKPDSLKTNMEEYESHILIDQLISEHVYEHKNNGRRIITNITENCYIIKTDVTCIKHVFDNIFSNIKKHSDPESPIIILAQKEEDGYLHISVTNGIPVTPNKVESTKIGLKTCKKMMNACEGDFKTIIEDQKFLAEVIVPIVREE